MLSCVALRAQNDRYLYDVVIKPAEKTYVKKEEVLYDSKRYRLYNNYLTVGPGYLRTNIRGHTQRLIDIDFQFHVKKHYFQAGLTMSGEVFLSTNNIEFHAGYGLRRERKKTNLAVFLGPTFFTGVTGTQGINDPGFYNGIGAYLSAQAIAKVISYDVGLGVEVFGELSEKQQMCGVKLILFFSGSYRGPEKNYNPNVRAQNPNLK